MEFYLLTLSLALLTGASAFFSASETSLFSLSAVTLRTYKKHPDKRKQLIAQLLSRPRDLLVSILMMNILVNILVQNSASHLFGDLSGWTLKVGVPLVLTLFFGEIIPKTLAIDNNITVSYRVAGAISWFRRFLGPLRQLITHMTSYLYRVLFFFLKKEESISKEELHLLLKTSEEHGVLQGNEVKLVHGYINLQEATVREVMHPREDVTFYKTSEPLSHLQELFSREEFSRIPISDDEIDDIKGIITVQQYFLHQHRIKHPHDLRDFISKPFFVPESTSARHLLRQLREKNEEMALIVDEYGSITGLITEEDLVEVVVGPITDRRGEKSQFTHAGSGIIIASGKLELTEFAEIFGSELKSDNNMVSIGGWLIEQLGDIPKSGTKFIGDGFLFHVLAAEPNRIRRVYIRKLSSKRSRDDNPPLKEL